MVQLQFLTALLIEIYVIEISNFISIDVFKKLKIIPNLIY